MEDALALLIVFGSTFGFAGFSVWLWYKTKQLQAHKGADTKELEKEREERKQLEARVQNPESIVAAADLELKTRPNPPRAGQSQVPRVAARATAAGSERRSAATSPTR